MSEDMVDSILCPIAFEEFKFRGWYDAAFRLGQETHQSDKNHPCGPGGVGHDSQSAPGEFFARAHFHLIVEGQTSPRVEGEVEIM